MTPIVAIVGPINAGKSTLFNRLAGQRLAVTSEVAGTTRDRQYAEIEWNNKAFLLVDTAGLSFDANENEILEKNVLKQIKTAQQEADILIFLVDGKETPESLDRKVLLEFRKSKKPVILAVNKLDSPKKQLEAITTFAKLGIKTIIPISSTTGGGTGDLLDAIATILPSASQATSQQLQATSSISIAIVGKPNVGKSSLFNKIIKSERMVVSPVPGTTRTAIDSQIDIDGREFTFIDTAGLKRKANKQIEPEIFSSYQVYKSIRRSDVCFLVIDISETITHQDLAIAEIITEQQKGCVIIANKIDIVGIKATKQEAEKTQALLSAKFPFLWMCPLFLVSAKTGTGVKDAIKAAERIYTSRHKTITQEKLDAFLANRMKENPPKRLKDQKEPKVFGLKQISTDPPAFAITVNQPSAISKQFQNALRNAIIKELDFWGTPIKVLMKKKM